MCITPFYSHHISETTCEDLLILKKYWPDPRSDSRYQNIGARELVLIIIYNEFHEFLIAFVLI